MFFGVLGIIVFMFAFGYLLILSLKDLRQTIAMQRSSPTAQITSSVELSTSTLQLPADTSTSSKPVSNGTPISTSTPQPTQTSIPPATTLGIGSTMISPKDGMKLMYVPAGDFLMGSVASDSNARPNEKPQHTVYLDAFWIDLTDVTNKMYTLCVSAGVCQPPTSYEYYAVSQYDNYPVVYVDWDMAKSYCEWTGRELPTEAQWEKAARGPNGNIYPWSNLWDGTRLNHCDFNCPFNNKFIDRSSNDGYATISPAGNYPLGASFYGVLDMLGNVNQWIADYYNGNYYEQSPSHNPLGPDIGSNPFGPGTGSYRVLRGSSWEDNSPTTSSYRAGGGTSWGQDYIGFRCAMSATK